MNHAEWQKALFHTSVALSTESRRHRNAVWHDAAPTDGGVGIAQKAYSGPVATGRVGSLDQSLHEPS